VGKKIEKGYLYVAERFVDRMWMKHVPGNLRHRGRKQRTVKKSI
jgi:hypothetical protein